MDAFFAFVVDFFLIPIWTKMGYSLNLWGKLNYCLSLFIVSLFKQNMTF